jgi:hypothetical protein
VVPPREPAVESAAVAEIVTAADTQDAGMTYAVAIDETVTAADTQDASRAATAAIDETVTAVDTQDTSTIYTAAISETATAADTQDATRPATTVTFDPTTVTAVTLSGGNLVATNTGTTSADQGARVATASGKTSGKYYFEITYTTINDSGIWMGAGTTASTYSGMGGGGGVTGVIMRRSSDVYSNGSTLTSVMWGNASAGQTIGIAVDLDNRRLWYRRNAGDWNNNATYSPTTNVGGWTIPAGTMVPFVAFGGFSGGGSGNVVTANFGASTFVAAAPSGFNAGWPT